MDIGTHAKSGVRLHAEPGCLDVKDRASGGRRLQRGGELAVLMGVGAWHAYNTPAIGLDAAKHRYALAMSRLFEDVATMVAPPGWRRSSIVPAPATPGQGGLTRVRRDGLSAMRADLLPGRL